MYRNIGQCIGLVAALFAVTACGANYLNGSAGPSTTGAGADGSASASAAGDNATSASSAGATSSTVSVRTIASQQNPGLCLGVKGQTVAAGHTVVVTTCDAAGSGQSFTLDNNGLLHVTDALCVAASLDANSPLTLANCSAAASDQVFAVEGNVLVSSASALCLAPADVTANRADTPAWMCACAQGQNAQQWAIGDGVLGMTQAEATDDAQASPAIVVDAAVAKPANAAKVLSSVKASSMASLSALVPSRLKAQMSNIEQAATRFNLQPQLLVAIAMQESTGGADQNAYTNQGGMFQFTNEDTWKEFGTQAAGDRQNDALSVTAAANYLGFLINAHNGNLSGALREYNGPIGQGGNPSYITDIFAKMRGKF